eukprot:6471791-Amphidinium_carterae.3
MVSLALCSPKLHIVSVESKSLPGFAHKMFDAPLWSVCCSMLPATDVLAQNIFPTGWNWLAIWFFFSGWTWGNAIVSIQNQE